MTTLDFTLNTPRPSPTAQKTLSILSQHLQPTNTTHPTTTAQQIDALIPMKNANDEEKESPENFLWEIWRVFIAITKQIPHSHDSQGKLVEVIRALRQLEPTETNIWGVSPSNHSLLLHYYQCIWWTIWY